MNPSVLKTRGQLSAVGAVAVGGTAVGATADDCAKVDTETGNTRHEITNVILAFIKLLNAKLPTVDAIEPMGVNHEIAVIWLERWQGNEWLPLFVRLFCRHPPTS